MRALLLACLVVPVLTAQSPVRSGVQPGSTTFTGNLVMTNTNPPPITQLFDVTVVDPAGITVTRFDYRANTSAGTTGTLGVWITALGLSHVGNQQNAAAWTQVATQTITHAGGTLNFTFTTPFYLAPGTYGMALHEVGANPIYTNPSTTTPPLPTTYSTAEVTLDMSVSRVRGSDPIDPFAGAGGGYSPRHPNIAMHYRSGPVSVDFAGTPTRGVSPLAVQFTAMAFSGNPGGILAYAWDFDGDSVVDSNLQNPAFTYNNCGDYTVSLTIVDGVGPTTVTKTNYIRTDLLTPGFTNTLVGNNVIQFVDTTVPTPMTWAWDFDGDQVVDSTLQNPLYIATGACNELTVAMTVSRACQPAVTLTKRIAFASTLETVFNGGTFTVAGATGGSNFFDVDVTNPEGLSVCAMHVHTQTTANTPLTVNVYQRRGSYVGFTTDSTTWRLVGTATVNSNGGGSRTFVPFSTPIYLAPGLNGLAVEQVGGSPRYSVVSSVQTYSNPDATITAGITQGVPVFGATATTWSPRVWNGALHYSTTTSNGAAGYGFLGEGCAGSLGVPGNVATTQPLLGAVATFEVNRLPLGVAFFLTGLSSTMGPFGPLPFDLAAFGAPGCSARISPDVTSIAFGAGNVANVLLPIPNAGGLLGLHLFTQALAVDPTANLLGGAMSDAAALVIGQ